MHTPLLRIERWTRGRGRRGSAEEQRGHLLHHDRSHEGRNGASLTEYSTIDGCEFPGRGSRAQAGVLLRAASNRIAACSLAVPSRSHLLALLRLHCPAPGAPADEARVFCNGTVTSLPRSELRTKVGVATGLHTQFTSFLQSTMNGQHPNLLPYKCFIEAGEQSFAVAEHYPYSLATVLKYNRHLIECDDGNDIIKQYIAYQLVQALAFLHRHRVVYPSLSPTAVILTEYLWVFLPLPSLSPPAFNSSLEYITTSWVSGHISNYDSHHVPEPRRPGRSHGTTATSTASCRGSATSPRRRAAGATSPCRSSA